MTVSRQHYEMCFIYCSCNLQQRAGCGVAVTSYIEHFINVYICKYSFQDVYNQSYLYTGESTKVTLSFMVVAHRGHFCTILNNSSFNSSFSLGIGLITESMWFREHFAHAGQHSKLSGVSTAKIIQYLQIKLGTGVYGR